jgi:two-component system NarL family response regulator
VQVAPDKPESDLLVTTKICVVSPFEPLRLGLVKTIDDTPDLEVVGEARDLADLVTKAAFRQADVLVVDSAAIPVENRGVYIQIYEWLPSLKVLFLGAPDDMRTISPEDIPTYMRLNTIGFILKDGPTTRLIDSIRLVAAGTFVCEIDLIRHILTRLTQWAQYNSDESARNGQQLSERETEVLALVARGFANKEIAHELFLSEGTVKAHVSHIMAKLSLDRRTDLVRYALSTGLVPLQDEAESDAAARRV